MTVKLSLLALSLGMLAGCVGGPCRYEITDGTCTVTQLATPSQATLFDFAADAGNGIPATGELYVPVGSSDVSPSPSCLAANHVTVGSQLPCSFEKETYGTCTPRIWKFPTFDTAVAGCP